MVRIITERLILRELSEQDATCVFKWLGDDRVSKYMVYDTYESVEQVKEWILSVMCLSTNILLVSQLKTTVT